MSHSERDESVLDVAAQQARVQRKKTFIGLNLPDAGTKSLKAQHKAPVHGKDVPNVWVQQSEIGAR
jgi:hypothetical protein